MSGLRARPAQGFLTGKIAFLSGLALRNWRPNRRLVGCAETFERSGLAARVLLAAASCRVSCPKLLLGRAVLRGKGTGARSERFVQRSCASDALLFVESRGDAQRRTIAAATLARSVWLPQRDAEGCAETRRAS